jgi:integrase
MKPKGRRRKGVKEQDPPATGEQWKAISRTYINTLTQIIVRIFGWGVTKKLVPATTWFTLKAVTGIKKGKNPKLRECRRVLPVPNEHVEAVLAVVSPEIGAMIRLQALTAMRPDEVTVMRPCDIDTSGDIWIYTLGDRSHGGMGHKTDHLDDGGDKFVDLGPRAQAVINPFLANCRPTEFLFSPKRAAERRYPHGNRGLTPKAKYDDDAYCRAVKRGCKRAGVPIWTPNRLRHNRATEVRAVFGLEHAQAVLDHRHVSTTEIYAEKQGHLKREVARRIG